MHKKRFYIVVFKQRRFGYYYDSEDREFSRGELVLVEADKGKDAGFILGEIREEDIPTSEVHKVGVILERLSDEEKDAFAQLRAEEKQALAECMEFVSFRGLPMKLVDAEYRFDKSKLTFYFTASGRVDFRELVRDLAAFFRTRIELKQIGVRDEAKICGGFGPCGREICCATFLRQFEPITTQFIKDQNLAVNPTKLSGLCGRLMCCLAYEHCFYKQMNEVYPHKGDRFMTPEGEAKVLETDYIRAKIKIKLPEDVIREIDFKEFKRLTRRRLPLP